MTSRSLSHFFILAKDELVQLWSRKRVALCLILYIGFVALLIYGFSAAEGSVTDTLSSRGVLSGLKPEEVLRRLAQVSGITEIENISQWPMIFPLFQLFAVLCMTELVGMVSSDIISRDRVNGSMRYLLLRTSKCSVFWGRSFAHVLLFIALHVLSLVTLALIHWLRMGEGISLENYLEPVFYYSAVMVPFIFLSVAIALLSSVTSRSTVTSLLKVHLLWLLIGILLLFDIAGVISHKSFLGLVLPFGSLLISTILSFFLLTAIFAGLSYLIFRGADV